MSSQEIKVQRSSYMTQMIKNHDWKLYNAFSSSINQVSLNVVFKLVLSSSSPTNLKIMSNHAKWSKKGNFEEKKNSLHCKIVIIGGKNIKNTIFFTTIWIGIKSWSIMQNAVKKWEIIPSYIENCRYNAIFGQKIWTKMYRDKKQSSTKPRHKVGQFYELQVLRKKIISLSKITFLIRFL